MPGVYHKYVGHDNNRDFVILTQEDTKAMVSISMKMEPSLFRQKAELLWDKGYDIWQLQLADIAGHNENFRFISDFAEDKDLILMGTGTRRHEHHTRKLRVSPMHYLQLYGIDFISIGMPHAYPPTGRPKTRIKRFTADKDGFAYQDECYAEGERLGCVAPSCRYCKEGDGENKKVEDFGQDYITEFNHGFYQQGRQVYL